MTIPKRFLDDLDDASAASRLLASGRSEVPSTRARDQALQALGIGVAAGVVGSASTASAATAAKAASLSTAPLAAASTAAGGAAAGSVATGTAAGGVAVVKATLLTGGSVKALLGVVAIVGMVGSGVAVSHRASEPVPPPAPKTVEAAPPVVMAPQITPTVPSPPLQALPLIESTALPIETVAPMIKAAEREPVRAVHAPEVSKVSEELMQLDAARSALRGGDGAQCLKKLDAYLASYPKGTLRFEADVLRCEALVQRGQRAEAEALAKRLLVQQPSGPYAARLRRLSTSE